jgi:mannosylglycerate hydrolase MGH1-like protein
MNRREFIARTALLAGAALPVLGRASRTREDRFAAAFDSPTAAAGSRLWFEITDPALAATYRHALDVLAANVMVLPYYPQPVLIEGSVYQRLSGEGGPHEGLIYSAIRPDVARNNQMAFFALQREDGEIPHAMKSNEIGRRHLQLAVPLAATAWELSQQTGDSELLETAYNGWSRFDAWLRRYRDTRQTGLCEGFCTFDTGQDKSPRWAGIPDSCPDGDARKCPPIPSLPRLCPDMSATVYGGRVALAAMARALGKSAEAHRWLADAEAIRSLILNRLYAAGDAAFYDLDAQDQFVRVRGEVIARVLGEHVADQNLFETIYDRQIHNPAAFWAPYPLTSIALDDPKFVRPIPVNSWGGASQALTALRATRWMEHYGKPADFAHLMQQWVSAICRANDFYQQIDPLNGTSTQAPANYSPAALALFDFTWRLAGVRQVGENIEWNVRPPAPATRATYRLTLTPTRVAELRYASGAAELLLNGKLLCRTSSTVRLLTDAEGKIHIAAGIAPQTTRVVVLNSSARAPAFSIQPNETLEFDGPSRN